MRFFMKKYFVLCLLASSLHAMEKEELDFLNLQKEDAAKMEEKAAKENKFAEIMQKSHKNSDSMTSDDYEFLSAYEKEHAAEREQKIKQEKDRPIVALERIANELEFQNRIGLLRNKIELLKLYVQCVGNNTVNELEDILRYSDTQNRDITFKYFVEVVKNLGGDLPSSSNIQNIKEEKQNANKDDISMWIKGDISF